MEEKKEMKSLNLTRLFKVVLTEIFGDGVMTGEELKILKNVREVLPIDSEDYKAILGEIASDLMKESRTMDEDANPSEIFCKCCDIAFSHEEPLGEELDLLKRLAKALNVPEGEIQKIIDEKRPGQRV